MTREQVEQVLRAAASILQESSFVVVGSQSVQPSHPNAPPELLAYRELDLYPAAAPKKADLIDGAIGALSQFDKAFGYYGDNVGPETATLPRSWMDRASLHYIGELTAICLELCDRAASKCAAGREKYADYVSVLFRERTIDVKTLVERVAMLDPARGDVPRRTAWARRRAAEAAA